MDIIHKTSSCVPSFLHIKQNLEQILLKVLGEDLLNELTNDRTEYNDFVHSIRTKVLRAGDKIPATLYLRGTITRHQYDINTALQQSGSGGIHISGNKLRLFPNVIRSILKEVGENILCLLETSLKELTIVKDQPLAIVFVGNLSRSVILQNIIKSAFPTHVLITPGDEETSVDVVKGTVMYGKNTIYKVMINNLSHLNYFIINDKLSLLMIEMCSRISLN